MQHQRPNRIKRHPAEWMFGIHVYLLEHGAEIDMDGIETERVEGIGARPTR
jgi:hypothetical protein